MELLQPEVGHGEFLQFLRRTAGRARYVSMLEMAQANARCDAGRDGPRDG